METKRLTDREILSAVIESPLYFRLSICARLSLLKELCGLYGPAKTSQEHQGAKALILEGEA